MIGSTLRAAGLAGLAVACVACGSATASLNPSARPTSAPTASVAPTAPASSPGQSGGRYRPSPTDVSTWPDACQMLTANQLGTVWPGTFTQTGTYGSLFSGGNTPHYTRCEYRQNTAKGDLIDVVVDVHSVQPVDQAHQQFAREAQGSQVVNGIGEEAFSISVYGEVEVRQGVTLWTVAVSESDDPTAKVPHAEQLARMVAPEFAS